MAGPTPDISPTANAAAAGLTDGTGVSRLTGSKVLKDLVADFLLTGAAAIGAGAALEALDLGAVIGAPEATAIALLGAGIRVAYRGLLRWATSP